MDFKTIITDLQSKGYTLGMIAKEIGTTRPGVSAIMHNEGQQPRWATGDKLIQLHRKAMRRKGVAN